MRHVVLCAFVMMLAAEVSAQLPSESQTFLTESLSRRNPDGFDLDKEELLPQLNHFDYSPLWTRYDENILAFTGDNYQRLRIKYLSIVKHAGDPSKYYVYGKRMVKSNVCQFLGEIELIHVRMFSESETERMYEDAAAKHDEETAEYYSNSRYTLLAEYRLFEDPNQEGTGYFEGILRTEFYVNGGKVFYDSLDIGSDGYRNNQYVGTWTSYAGAAPERSNWGEWRIPYPGDLGSQIEGADFWPKHKYWDRGWDTYSEAMKHDSAAQKEEDREWWKDE